MDEVKLRMALRALAAGQRPPGAVAYTAILPVQRAVTEALRAKADADG